MQYFGVPKCPYCKKRVNFIRTWSLKRQGEYQCPRCGGISNIFLSPLVYVFALLAVFSGAAVYFFHKFILDDVDLTTVFQVILPFAVFFLLSLFLVYLAKPVIKRVPREEQGKKARPQPTAEDRRAAVNSSTGRIYADQGDYLPPVDYRTGPVPQQPQPAAQRPAPPRQAPAPQPGVSRPAPAATPAPRQTSPAAQRRQAAQQVAAQGEARRPRPAQPSQETQARVSSAPRPSAPAAAQRPAPQRQAPAPRPAAAPQREAPRPAPRPAESAPAPQPARQQPARPAANTQPPRRASHVVRSVEIPDFSEDFFKKYDDPAYVERRLKELEEKQNKG